MTFSTAHRHWLDGASYSHTDTDPKDCPACQARTEQAYAESAALQDGHRVPADAPGIFETLAVISAQLGDLLALQRRMLAAMGQSSDSRSSIEVKTSTRGVDVASKSYADSSMDGLSERAVDAYFATLADVQRRLNGEVPA